MMLLAFATIGMAAATKPKPEAQMTKAEREAAWQAVQTCQFAIQATVHDPKSLDFPDGVSWSYRELRPDGTHRVQIRIRARHAMNALRLATIECTVGPQSKLINMRQVTN